jgi:hypothetical protein
MANPTVECDHHDNPEILVCLSDPRHFGHLQYAFFGDDFTRIGSARGASLNLVMMATSGIGSVEDRTDKMRPVT